MSLTETIRSLFRKTEQQAPQEICEFVYDPFAATGEFNPPMEVEAIRVPVENAETFRKRKYLPMEEYARIYRSCNGDDRVMLVSLVGYKIPAMRITQESLVQMSMN